MADEVFSSDGESYIDMDKLLVLVEARPVIYDTRRKDHHNQDAVAKAWRLVGQAMNIPSAECKQKWHTLRSSYGRYLRGIQKLPRGSGKKRKWHLADAMSFLLPFMGPMKKPTSNEVSHKSPEEQGGTSVLQSDEKRVDGKVEGEEGLEETPTESRPNTSTANLSRVDEVNPRKRKHRTADVVEPVAAYFKTADDHPMLMYFKGLMPDIAKLSDKSQRRFKTDMLNTLNYYLDMEEDGSMEAVLYSRPELILRSFLEDKVYCNPFWKLVLDFWELRHEPNVLFLTYEEMRQNTAHVVKRTANFLGRQYTKEQEAALLDHLDISNMRKNESVNFTRRTPLANDGEEESFIRKGEVGAWKDVMDPDMIRSFDEWTARNLEGSDFPRENL